MKRLLVVLMIVSLPAVADERCPTKTPNVDHPVIGTTTTPATHHESWVDRNWWIGPLIGAVSVGAYFVVTWGKGHAKTQTHIGAASGTRYYENVGKPIDGFR